MSSTLAPPSASRVADAIARIEERRDALDRLAAKGMEMLERIAAGEVVEIAGRKPFAGPARAFAVISRAVRLCLALASRLDEELIALLRGGPIPTLAILAPEAPVAPKASVAEPETPARSSAPRARIARAVDAVIAAETGDGEAAERLRAYVHEHLIEGEDYDRYLHQPWRVVVGTLCADLGLHPDWSKWDNTEGFTAAARPPTAKPLASRIPPPPEPEPEIDERHRGPEPP
jgi:hypothetical protein